MARWTSADVLAYRNTEELIGLILETLQIYPEIANFFAVPIEQTTYKTLVETALPEVAFREDNVGRATQRPTWEVRNVECKFLDASWDVDVKVVNEFAWGIDKFLAEQTRSHIEAALSKIAIQTWYGITADPTGFIGIASYLNSLSIPTVIDAGGRTANGCTSVFAVSTGLQKVGYAWGREGKIFDGPVERVRINDPNDPAKVFHGWGQQINGHVGLQVGTPKCIGRIANIDATHPLTDDLLSKLIESFETGFRPDAFYMTRQSQGQLQRSRTPVNITGVPAPFPNEAFGYPIHVTDSLKMTEAVVPA